MKKTILIIAVFIGLCHFAIAKGGDLKYGPVLGLNMATLSGDNSDQVSMKIGFHIGGIVEFPLSDNFMIAPGILFSTKGDQAKADSKFKTNLNYLEIPINAKYSLESGLNFFAGPYVGILMSAKATDGTNDTDIKDQVTSTDIGLNVGLGFDMESGLGFSAQYGFGFSNLQKSVNGATTGTNTNAVIGISVRYMLGGK